MASEVDKLTFVATHLTAALIQKSGSGNVEESVALYARVAKALQDAREAAPGTAGNLRSVEL